MHIDLKKALAVIILASAPLVASASGRIYVTVPSVSVAPGQEFIATVGIDTGDDRINAVSGALYASKSLLVRGILDGGSTVPMWIERPTATTSGAITFAGIIPGGLAGKGELFKVILAAAEAGSFKIEVRDAQALAQGQDPSPIALTAEAAKVRAVGPQAPSSVFLGDTTPPEAFAVSVSSDPSAFDGALFASFAAIDKQSGIRGYEAAYTYFLRPDDSAWAPIESPYRLPPEASGKLVWIRATDAAGNHTAVHTASPGYYRNIAILAIILVILLCSAHFALQRSRSRRSSH